MSSINLNAKTPALARLRVAMKARLEAALDNASKTAAALRDGEAERQRKAVKLAAPSPQHDQMVRANHQQTVAAATAPTRASVKTAASHVQAAMRGPAPGLQLRSVRVAPAEAGSAPKQHGYAWVAPKARK